MKSLENFAVSPKSFYLDQGTDQYIKNLRKLLYLQNWKKKKN